MSVVTTDWEEDHASDCVHFLLESDSVHVKDIESLAIRTGSYRALCVRVRFGLLNSAAFPASDRSTAVRRSRMGGRTPSVPTPLSACVLAALIMLIPSNQMDSSG